LGVGLGLRPPHYAHILEHRPNANWFEALTENYLGLHDRWGGKPLQVLEAMRRDYPLTLHGVSLSIGSTDPLDTAYLARVRELAARVEPLWISDHLCWTGVAGESLHDLLPLPYTEEAITHVSERMQRVQDALGRRILLENVSSYLTFAHSHLQEWEFVTAVAERADCGILLDVNNIYVSALNHGFDPQAYLAGIPSARVGEMHLAGHSRRGDLLVDTHDGPVCPEVWELYRQAVLRFGCLPTLIEWDANIPDFAVLAAEADRAGEVQAGALADARLGSTQFPESDDDRSQPHAS
jgi:hypothetical protein